MGTAAATATAVIGIDVPKATFDACLLAPDGKAREKAFPNTPDGHAALLAWADGHGAGADARFGREATGGYEDALACHRHAAGRAVRVINPTRVKYAGVMRGRRNKTDRADARLIAAYTRDENPPPWSPPAPEVRELQALVRRRDDLRGLAAHEKARRDATRLTPAARKSVARVIKLLGKEADALPAAADALIAATPALAADAALLASLPGVGTQTASTVLAELPALDRVPSAQSAAAYGGLSPREFKSGSSVRGRTRLSKSGNARLRTARDLPTLTAVRFNPVLKGFFDRLVAAGKPKMQAVDACLRKLVMICYGVLKNRKPFDPAWGSRIAT